MILRLEGRDNCVAGFIGCHNPQDHHAEGQLLLDNEPDVRPHRKSQRVREEVCDIRKVVHHDLNSQQPDHDLEECDYCGKDTDALEMKTIRTVSIVTSHTRARKMSRGRITHAYSSGLMMKSAIHLPKGVIHTRTIIKEYCINLYQHSPARAECKLY